MECSGGVQITAGWSSNGEVYAWSKLLKGADGWSLNLGLGTGKVYAWSEKVGLEQCRSTQALGLLEVAELEQCSGGVQITAGRKVQVHGWLNSGGG